MVAPEGRHRRGQAILVAVFFFTAISAAAVFAFAFPLARETQDVRRLRESRQVFAAAESGVEDVVYRLNNTLQTAASQTLALNSTEVTTTVTNVPPDRKRVLGDASLDTLVRRAEAEVVVGTGAAFNFGVQAGDGGIVMQNSASVRGNVYSNGPVVGSNSNIVRGDVISAGSDGLVRGIHATSSVYAHTISNNTIDGNAYFQVNGGGNTVAGTLFPGSADQPESDLPISDQQIDEWKADALAGGVALCEDGAYTITGDTTLGPVKIPCDVKIKGTGFTVTLTGAVWIEGNITIENSPTIRVAPALGGNSVVLIADNPANPDGSGSITIQNSAVFQDSGTDGSYVLVISQNRSAENGGTIAAIAIENSANGDVLLYAGHGEVRLKNSISLKEVTAWRVGIHNTAEVVYETGLANLIFTGGPSGGFQILSWQEVE